MCHSSHTQVGKHLVCVTVATPSLLYNIITSYRWGCMYVTFNHCSCILVCVYVLWVFHGDCVLSRALFSRLYQFSGTSSSSSLLAEPAFQPVFARYQGKEAVPPECILGTPGSGDVGTIAVWPGRQTSTPQNLAWLTSEEKGDERGMTGSAVWKE